jgi:hypothetical protein
MTSKSGREDSVRIIATRMLQEVWHPLYSKEFIVKRENILNQLWLQIYAPK